MLPAGFVRIAGRASAPIGRICMHVTKAKREIRCARERGWPGQSCGDGVI